MRFEIAGIWSECDAVSKLQQATGIGPEAQTFRPLLSESLRRDCDTTILAHGPESFVKHPVGVFAQGQAVRQIVIL